MCLTNEALRHEGLWRSVAVEVSGKLHVPAALLPGKEPTVAIGWEVGWAPKSVWTISRKFLALQKTLEHIKFN
jgi:hypothetical protein